MFSGLDDSDIFLVLKNNICNKYILACISIFFISKLLLLKSKELFKIKLKFFMIG